MYPEKSAAPANAAYSGAGSLSNGCQSAVVDERRSVRHIQMFGENLQRLSALSAGLNLIAERLVGPRPPSGEKTLDTPQPNNFEANIVAASSATASLISDCERSLRAIEEFI